MLLACENVHSAQFEKQINNEMLIAPNLLKGLPSNKKRGAWGSKPQQVATLLRVLFRNLACCSKSDV